MKVIHRDLSDKEQLYKLLRNSSMTLERFVMALREFRMFHTVVLKDGTLLSIQASCFHNCSPRETLDIGEYTSVEVGVVKSSDEMKNYLQRCYVDIFHGLLEEASLIVGGYISVNILLDIIAHGGGIDFENTLLLRERVYDKKK